MVVEKLLGIQGIECEIVKRVNRFVVEVFINGRIEKAHVNNTGRLSEYMVMGRRAYCIKTRPRKTGYRVFAIEDRKDAALIDTQLQMRAFERCLELKALPWLDCTNFKRNQRVNSSLIDYLLFCPEPLYLEVKSAVLRVGDTSMYPDCPTLRGRKHIAELIRLMETSVAGGCKACVLFIAAVPRVKVFKPNWDVDAVIGKLLIRAKEAGVEIRAINLFYRPHEASVILVNPDLRVSIDSGR